MALITISGFPCAGKSTRACQIKDYLSQKISQSDYGGPLKKVSILSDHSLGLIRSCYDGIIYSLHTLKKGNFNAQWSDSKSEKTARGSLFSALQRQLSLDTILIVDSLNYIKGFRYQMYCAAREMKLRTCTVYIVVGADLCKEWNAARCVADTYAPKTLDNLLVRFEEPSSMVRWDAPLFTVLTDDKDIPGSHIWDALTKGNVKPPNSGTLHTAKVPTDALQTLEKVTAAVSSSIALASSSQTMGGSQIVFVGELQISLTLPHRSISLSELQRHKRQFVTIYKKTVSFGTTERGTVDWTERSIAQKFAQYLEEHLAI